MLEKKSKDASQIKFQFYFGIVKTIFHSSICELQRKEAKFL